MSRTLIIGDIHGCYDELMTLLERVALSSDDQIISVGDIGERGPKPREVVEFFMNTPNATAIRGNHEEKYLQVMQGKLKPSLSHLIMRWQLGDQYEVVRDYFASLPAYIELPEAVIVHGYYEPGVPLSEQQERVLVGMGNGEKYLIKNYKRPWFERYDGEKPIIVGHRDYTTFQQVFNYQGRVWGIDTRCVYGGLLTGLILPDWELVQVPAKTNYWGKISARYMD